MRDDFRKQSTLTPVHPKRRQTHSFVYLTHTHTHTLTQPVHVHANVSDARLAGNHVYDNNKPFFGFYLMSVFCFVLDKKIFSISILSASIFSASFQKVSRLFKMNERHNCC